MLKHPSQLVRSVTDFRAPALRLGKPAPVRTDHQLTGKVLLAGRNITSSSSRLPRGAATLGKTVAPKFIKPTATTSNANSITISGSVPILSVSRRHASLIHNTVQASAHVIFRDGIRSIMLVNPAGAPPVTILAWSRIEPNRP